MNWLIDTLLYVPNAEDLNPPEVYAIDSVESLEAYFAENSELTSFDRARIRMELGIDEDAEEEASYLHLIRLSNVG